MRTSRRTFLHQAAVAAGLQAAWQSGLFALGSTSAPAAIAASTGRKLALLVGVDRYPSPFQSLQGCATDVELQRDLLVRRLGFASSDIVILQDAEATRDRIEAAFIDHLVAQAGKDDAVFFHFSGYGRLIRTGTPWQSKTSGADAVLAPALVPIDADISDGSPDNLGFQPANDLPLETLYLLLQALKTANATLVLDCGFSTARLLSTSNFRLRSPAQSTDAIPRYTLGKAALDFQRHLRGTYRISSTSTFNATRAAQCKGTFVFAGFPPSTAAEANWGDYSAGLFTQALTRALADSATTTCWREAIAATKVELRRIAPEFDRVRAEGRGTTRNWLNGSGSGTGEAGWVQSVEGDRATLCLSGVSPMVLPYLNAGTQFGTADGKTILELRSRQGMTAKAELVKSDGDGMVSVQLGDAVTEVGRMVSNKVELAVALSDSLERIEKVDAIGALSSVNLADGFDFIQTLNPREGLADCLFGKLTKAVRSTAARAGETLPPPNSYGLFSPGGTPLWDTFGVADEAPKMAVQRLAPRLRHLLAAKRLRMTANDSTTPLAIAMTLASDTMLWQQATVAAARADGFPQSKLTNKVRANPVAPVRVRVGERLYCELENVESRSLSVCLFVLDSIGTISVLVPPAQSGTPTELLGHSALDIDTWLQGQFVVQQPPGPAEFILVASPEPLTETQNEIVALAQKLGVTHGFIALPRPLELVQTLLDELMTAGGNGRSLQDRHWATLPTLYTVI
ncbi:MAG: caspase family protein [Cyanobacteria bacterium P01_F01_bin.33]